MQRQERGPGVVLLLRRPGRLCLGVGHGRPDRISAKTV